MNLAVMSYFFLAGLGMYLLAYEITKKQNAAFIAASKQAVYTFLAGGLLTRCSENLALRFKDGLISRLTSALIPSTLTVGATYLIHSLKGTPEPF